MGKMIVLNHKMNLEYDEVYEYIDGINKIDTDNNLVICPSSIYLENFINTCTWGIGSQNVYYKEDGDYTGEISTLQLKSLGIEYCIVGHYERRKIFKESIKLIKKKLNACLDSNIIPILCFGSAGSEDSIKNDLEELLDGIKHIDFIVFAYEPLELQNVPSIDTIKESIDFIYDYLHDKYNSKPNIIYGGGVDKDNVNDIIKIDKLNGVLIGNDSYKIEEVNRIIESIE